MKKIYWVISLFVLGALFSCNQASPKTSAKASPKENTKEVSPVTKDVTADTILLQMLNKYQAKIPEEKENYRIALDNFVHEESKIPSSFSRYLMRETSIAISNCSFLKEYPRDKLDAILREQKRTTSDLFDPETSTVLGA